VKPFSRGNRYIIVKNCIIEEKSDLDNNKKEKITTWLLAVLIATLIGSFLFIFLGYFKVGLAFGAIFMLLATFLAEWTRDKNAVYLHRKEYENRFKR
jgi:uncharacterized membrane protein